SQPQLATAHDLARRHQCAGTDEGVVLDHRAVQDPRPHADQAVVADAAGMHDGAVADGDVGADLGREATRLRVRPIMADVDDRAVLHVGAVADADVVDVAADHAAGPDRHVIAQLHPADDGRGGVHVHALAQQGLVPLEGSDVHGRIVAGESRGAAAGPAYRTRNSIRRFRARPSSGSLPATGRSGPKPCTPRLSASTPAASRYSFTAIARCRLRVTLAWRGPTLSVWPITCTCWRPIRTSAAAISSRIARPPAVSSALPLRNSMMRSASAWSSTAWLPPPVASSPFRTW